jgi:thiamine-monophosphate kinase
MSTHDTSNTTSQTPIAALGEFGLIKRLTQDIKLQQPSSLKGIGDDAAVLDYTKHGQDMQTLVTSDLLLEGIHFNL